MTQFYGTLTPEKTEREEKNMQLVRKGAGECMVLLENDGALPLKNTGKIALYGAGARHTIKGGTGSGDVNSREVINIEQGLKDAGFTITTDRWLTAYDEFLKETKAAHQAEVNRLAEERQQPPFIIEFELPFKEPDLQAITEEDVKASDTDTAVLVIARNSGEGADRWNKKGDYLLNDGEVKALEFLGAHYEKTIVLLNIGGIIDATVLKETAGINAVLLTGQLGNSGGLSVADVLTGKQVPSGKLTDTWAKAYADYPSSEGFSHNNGNIDDEYYTDGIYVGYRYFDTFGIEPHYCFGYGKGYTDFAIENVKAVVEGSGVKVTARVTNTGKAYAGKEVVQVYVSAPEGALEKPYQELKAYKKTALLAPGESETAELTFALKDMASYSEEKAAWILEPGEYLIRVGNSSRNTHVAAVLTVEEEKRTEQLKNLFNGDKELNEISGKGRKAYTYETEAEEIKNAERITVPADAVETRTVVYQEARPILTTDKTEKLTIQDVIDGKATVEELAAQLTVEELADLCVGTLRTSMGGDPEGKDNVIGNASATVPGAAGDTSSIIWESRGVKNLILADGPAGLRLQPLFKTTKEGTLLPGGEGMGDIFAPFDESRIPADAVDHYQYCTAIPIGTELAQTWNPELIEEIGYMVGKEMQEFHVDLWLAPALNIHRNPLCGRNFEYYSEDPLVAGKCAAAMTIGVQKDGKGGTTIKHFAANNLEDNRMFSNNHMSERALREIYLKGFEIAVKEAQPLSIMTSYNLINGLHTANSHDLIQAAARDEWGFEGVVMTDWFTSQDMPVISGTGHIYPISASTGCVYAGNDLQMPGCQKNVDDIVEAVKTGKELDGYRLTLGDVQFCVTNLLRVVAKVMK